MTEMLLFDMSQLFSSVLFVWVVGGIVFVILCLMIIRQRRQGIQLRSELAELDKMLQSNVAYEFILKAMKIAIWRYDASTQSIHYEHDFREGMDSYVPGSNENFKQTLMAISPADIDHVNKAFGDLCSGVTDFYHQEYQVINHAAGKSYWEESYATIVERNEEGIPTQIVGTSMRVDKRKEMESALIQARNKAEESDRLKTAFLANMGHEIRTPLNAIVGFADLLPVVQSDEDRNQLIQEIQMNNQKLLRIINGLVSMSEIEAGALSMAKDAIDLNALLQETVNAHQPTTNIPIELHLPSTQVQIHADSDAIKEIMENLLQNAIKFTTEGVIALGYDVEGDQVRLWVQDSGKGIAQEDQERIFERFVKVDEFVPGTGLGLSVVKSHAANLGGTVGVESVLGQGSLFWVQLPIT
jgi:signal transduction histidine kinase